MRKYWQAVWKQRSATRFFSGIRAIPSIGIAVIQFFVLQRTSLIQMWITITIIIGVYLILYAGETLWNFAALSPPLLDQTRTDRIALLDREIASLKLNPVEQQRYDLVGGKIAELSADGQNALKTILLHGTVTIFDVTKVGIGRFDYLQECLNRLLVSVEGQAHERVFFVNPEFKTSVETYFKKP